VNAFNILIVHVPKLLSVFLTRASHFNGILLSTKSEELGVGVAIIIFSF